MAIDEDETYLAVLAGKTLIMRQQKPMQLHVYKIVKNRVFRSEPLFQLHKEIVIKDMKEFDNEVSSQFYFKIYEKAKKKDTLLFAQKNRIISFNYMTGQIKTVCEFGVRLGTRPEFFLLNDTQTSFVVANENDGIFLNMEAEGGP